jgi:molybdopterin-binding protein
MSDVLTRKVEGLETYIDMLKIGIIGGTGGLLSHAPDRVQSALALIDGFQPEGVTGLIVDSVFMMPHLGVLSTVHPKAAVEIFEKDCLVRLGTCIAFKGQLKDHEYGRRIGTVTLTMPGGKTITEEANYGTIKRIPLREGETAVAEIKPEQGFQIMEKGLLPS